MLHVLQKYCDEQNGEFHMLLSSLYRIYVCNKASVVTDEGMISLGSS